MHDVAHLLAGALICRYYSLHHWEGVVITLASAADSENVWQNLKSVWGCIRIWQMHDCASEQHGSFTHTTIYALILVIVAHAGIWCMRRLRHDQSELPPGFLAATVLAALSHMLLDTISIQTEDAKGTHQYMWPLTDFEFHLNTIFGDSDAVRTVRWTIEWLLFHPIAWWGLLRNVHLADTTLRQWLVFVLLAVPTYFSPFLFGLVIVLWISSLPVHRVLVPSTLSIQSGTNWDVF